ncbi:hypothetical protein IW138_003415 [Coemansia sp. RSA 986]|nr:hypothetical protein IW138_003415 [Coemansia sp. RSA 986]
MNDDSVSIAESFGPRPSQYNERQHTTGPAMSGALTGGGGHRGANHQEGSNWEHDEVHSNINRTPPLGSDSGSCAQCAAEESAPTDTTRGNNTPGPVYAQAPATYNSVGSGPQPYPPASGASVAAGPAARPRPSQQQFVPGAYPSPAGYGPGVAAGPGVSQLYTPVSMSNPSMYSQPQQPMQPDRQQYGGGPPTSNMNMPAPGAQYQQSPSPPQQQPQNQQGQQPYTTGNSSNSSLYGPQSGSQAPRQETVNSTYYGPGGGGNVSSGSRQNTINIQSESSGFSYNNSLNTAANTAANAAAGGGINNASIVSSVLPGPYNTSGNVQQQNAGYAQSNYAPSLGGVSAYDANQASTQPMYITEDPPTSTDRMGKAGKIALGALAAGAVAYGVHELVDHHISPDNEKKSGKLQEIERQRREAEARRRREEEEMRRREEYERWRREEENRRRQQEALNMQYQQQQYQYQQQQQHQQQQQQHQQHQQHQQAYASQAYAPRPQRADSVGSHHSHHSNEGTFAPPAPFGRPPYTYNPNDVRHPDPTRNSENSGTPQTYPELRQGPSDPVIKIGTIVALKHAMTGRFLHSDRSHSTVSGSNQQLVYGHRSNADENDLWQVLPANRDIPVPGSIVAYGTQIRLRHLETGRHLHSQYTFKDRMGNNEVSAFGDQTLSDEYDHWVVERWNEGAYGQTWKSTDTVVLRHYVSGMVLHSHDVMLREHVQSVVCTGNGTSENAKWRLALSK